MTSVQENNPLHGVTLESMLTTLVERLGWEFLAEKIAIQCFRHEPSIKSSLKFLRRTPWAREKVEMLYLWKVLKIKPKPAQTSPRSSTAGKARPGAKTKRTPSGRSPSPFATNRTPAKATNPKTEGNPVKVPDDRDNRSSDQPVNRTIWKK